MLISIFITLLAAFAQPAYSDLPPYNTSTLFDLGVYGAYPTQKHVTVDYTSPRINIKQWSEECDDGRYILLTPRGSSVADPGPMLLDNKGNMIWFGKEFGMVTDLKVQRYKGDDYLTFGPGGMMERMVMEATICGTDRSQLNSSYDVVRTIQPAGDLLGDLHEFTITPTGTALMTIYASTSPADLQSFGLPKPTWIMDGLFQELDIATGALLFQWTASDHYNVSDTLAPIDNFDTSPNNAFDYFHINSIDKDDSGNYYISSRYMQTVTCISPSGAVLWKLGGRHTDFRDLSSGAASNFSWQHHVRWHPGNRLTIFDNGAYNWLSTATHSRGLYVQLDTHAMTVELIQAFEKTGILAHSQGSMQLLPESGNVFIGWGHSAAYTEFAANGTILRDFHFGPSAFFGLGWAKSYRVVKAEWVGKPRTRPSVVWDEEEGAVYVSWNGATEVVEWRVEGAMGKEGEFVEVRRMGRKGFETRIEVGDVHAVGSSSTVGNSSDGKSFTRYRVAALDGSGEVIGMSLAVDITSTDASATFWRGASFGAAGQGKSLDLLALGVLFFILAGFVVLVLQIRAVFGVFGRDLDGEQSSRFSGHEKARRGRVR